MKVYAKPRVMSSITDNMSLSSRVSGTKEKVGMTSAANSTRGSETSDEKKRNR